MRKEILIVPDVHGRDFWRDVLPYKDTPIVFLGDYLSPYTQYDDITNEQAIEGFKEILQFRQDDPDRVTLLLGNHDISYSVGTNICNSRVDYKNYDLIRKMYWDKKNKFQLTLGKSIASKKFIFSHAGYTKTWLLDSQELFMTEDLDRVLSDWDYLNRMNERHSDLLYRNLKKCGYRRGGYNRSGSPIWADFTEHVIDAKKETDQIQVFGHSWCKKAIHGECQYDWYMLDCAEVFYIDETGTIRYLSNDKMVDHVNDVSA